MNPISRALSYVPVHTLKPHATFLPTGLISGPRLTEKMLSDVISGRALACSVPNFISPEASATLTDRLTTKLPYAYYTYAQGSVGRIGFSFSEANTPETREKYYRESRVSLEAIREACGDIGSPIDKFRVALQDAWGYGANFEMLNDGQKMFVGLCRMIEANKNILPHQDMVWWYDSFSEASQQILTQLTMNIYLKVPESGGELELWNWGFNDKEEYEQHAAGSYGIDKSKLPAPDLKIKPQVGEVILFNPGKLHCIGTGSEQRFTVSCFVGFHGNKKPLTWWS